MSLGIVGVRVENRADKADDVQKIITQYGDSILSRMGVPSPDRFVGIITLTIEAEEKKISDFVAELERVEGVVASYCTL